MMTPDRAMYRWRQMTVDERQETLQHRQRQSLPWHLPPHYESGSGWYLLTAACYEHRPVLGLSPERMAAFETELLSEVESSSVEVLTWVILPNHYHFLARVPELGPLLATLGRLHGRTSHRWNGEEGLRGRQVWCRAAETAMKSDRHLWATVNYVLHNPVRHGYVEWWQDWPYSNATQYLAAVGRDEVERRWREHPLLEYGDDWDPAEM
jgi:putative transposase